MGVDESGNKKDRPQAVPFFQKKIS